MICSQDEYPHYVLEVWVVFNRKSKYYARLKSLSLRITGDPLVRGKVIPVQALLYCYETYKWNHIQECAFPMVWINNFTPSVIMHVITYSD